MQIPVKWLQEYMELTSEDLGRLMETLEEGAIQFDELSITRIESLFDKTKSIEVGNIVRVDPHPEAEFLVILQVDVGEEEHVQIVTGATNCNVGDFAPIVRKNGRIADGTKIKKGRLRGVESYGMLCSLEELGYDSKVVPDEMADNIYILESAYGNFIPGMDIVQTLPELRDHVISIEVPNGKQVGVSEIAVSLARYLGKELRPSADENLCKVSRVVDVKSTKSPDWMKLRLMKSGIKPMSYLENAVKYIEFEFGMPMDIRSSEQRGQTELGHGSNFIELEINIDDKDTLKKKYLQVREDQADEVALQMMHKLERLLVDKE